eukprot:2442107-Rhodomonas_salina.2
MVMWSSFVVCLQVCPRQVLKLPIVYHGPWSLPWNSAGTIVTLGARGLQVERARILRFSSADAYPPCEIADWQDCTKKNAVCFEV